MGYDYVISWPSAEIAVMGSDQAVNIINKKEKASKDWEKIKSEKIKEYSDKFLNPYVAASEGKVDKIILPKDTRGALIRAIEMLASKRDKRPSKKHGNIPL